ncbi:MAG: hypothetical protein R2748_19275 [Bryobacterales bacterium]
MLNRSKAALAAAVLALTLSNSAAALQAQESPWIHVEVIDSGDKAEKVNVNVPLALAQVALDALPEDITGKITSKFQEKGIKLADLRKLWAELKNSGDAEFVKVESEEETVRVSRAGQLIQVRVEDRKGDAPEQVRVDIPVDVVDALLSGEGEELNLRAAIQQLSGRRGDIVNVTDAKSKVASGSTLAARTRGPIPCSSVSCLASASSARRACSPRSR